MTLVTICVLQLIVAIHVTCLASNRLVCTCQWEVRGAMIKGAPSPACRRVTLCAVVAEIPRNMVRVRCLLELCLMTLVALSVMQLVVAIHVA